MRTYEDLKKEMKLRKALGLPRITLTPKEKVRAFGDTEWPNRDPNPRIELMVQRFKEGLKLSKSDLKEVKQYLKGK
jgi:hypothetical protein